MSESTKGFIANNWFKLFFVALAVILLAIYFYRENRLDACIQSTDEYTSRLWDEKCAIQKQSPNCGLDPFTATAVNGTRDKRLNECFRRYSFK